LPDPAADDASSFSSLLGKKKWASAHSSLTYTMIFTEFLTYKKTHCKRKMGLISGSGIKKWTG
jgi:hypothetical protein